MNAEWAKAAKVDNASNLDDVNDRHPCGPGPILGHSFVKGVCEDCEYRCEHAELLHHSTGVMYWCEECGEDVEVAAMFDTVEEARGDK